VQARGYEAISYVWGSSECPHYIDLDEGRVPLTESLYNVLRRFRLVNRDRVLWTDAICINQDDNEEKAWQITLMPKIYFSATRVLAYLGDEADGSEDLPLLFDKLLKADFHHISADDISDLELVKNGLPVQDDLSWDVLVAFVSRPWFERVWIVQEVVMSRDLRVFCGAWESPFETIALAVWNIGQFGMRAFGVHNPGGMIYSRSLMLSQMLSLKTSKSKVASAKRYVYSVEHLSRDGYISTEVEMRTDPQTMFSLRLFREFPHLRAVVMAVPDDDGQYSEAIEPVHLISLLCGVNFSKATKDHDRFYALMGLAFDISHSQVYPNYDEPIAKTNERICGLMVEKGHGLELLYRVSNEAVDLEDSTAPSWMPKWSQPWLPPLLTMSYAMTTNISERLNAGCHVTLVEGENTIKSPAFRVDTCSRCTTMLFPHSQPYGELMRAFFDEAEAFLSGEEYFTKEPWPEVRWRTLVANKLTPNLEPPPEFPLEYEEMRNYIRNPEPHPMWHMLQVERFEHTNRWVRSLITTMGRNKLCRTKNGYVAVVPEATAENDEIYFLKGALMPFVLRHQTRPGYFRLVGPCYVHGFMDKDPETLDLRAMEIRIQ